MTVQEFVKKEAKELSDKMFATGEWSETKLLVYNEFKNGASNGLTKGLEIAADVLDFPVNKYFSVERLDGKTYWAKSGDTGNIQYLTTTELLSIYLTEINEKK